MNWFQTDECYEFYYNLPFLEAFRFEVKREDEVKGSVVGYIQKDGGILKQFFSRRAIITGGPYLADDITETEISELLESCKSGLKGKCIYIETRNFMDYSLYKSAFLKSKFIYEPHYDYLISTSNLSEAINKISHDAKTRIRKSQKLGATVCISPSQKQIKEFYQILLNLYKGKIKTPLLPYTFFDNLLQLPEAKCFIVLNSKNQTIGGGIRIVSETDNTLYNWYAGCDNINYKSISPSYLLNYESILYAYHNDMTRIDMMGAGSPNDGGYGVRDFKAKFGGDLVEYGRFKCIMNKPLYFIGVLGVKILKKLK